MNPLRKPARALLVVALLTVMALQLAHVARATSATWDEPHHLIDGYTILTLHDYRLNPEVPPLIKIVAALPLLHHTLTIPPNQGRSIPEEAFLDGRALVFTNGPSRTLEPARLACILFTLALGLLLYLFAREAFGYTGALVALALFVFDPNFLAHGALVTTDTGSACLFLATIYAFYRYCRQPSWLRLLLTAIAAGLLLAAKFTGIFFLPMLLLIVLAEWLITRNRKTLLHHLAALALITLCAWCILWSFYGFRYKASPTGELNPTLSTYLGRMYDQPDAHRLATLAHYHVLPEAYLWGLENTKQTEFEDNSYFWGRVYRHGNWQYFPVAFLIKSTLPFLILLALGVLAFPTLRHKPLELTFLLIPPLLYFAISMHSDMNIGVRHLLPVYSFLYVLIGAIASTLLARSPRWTIPIATLLVWQIITSVRVSPAYMAYGNEAWGGPSQVHRYLSDANVDWAQQLYAVKAYLDANHIPEDHCWFDYFADGAIQPSDYGIHCHRLPTTSTLWWLDLPMSVPPAIDGTVLISDSNLAGIEFGDGPLNPLEPFRTLTPTATIQHGIYVYTGHFDVPLASALVQAHEAGKLAAANHLPEALAKALSAASLAPDSVPVQTTYGDILVATNHRDEALVTYQTALHLAQTTRPDLQATFAAILEAKIQTLRNTPTH